MTAGAAVLLVASGVAAVADWVAVGVSRKAVEYVAKPAVMVGLIAVALALALSIPRRGGSSSSHWRSAWRATSS